MLRFLITFAALLALAACSTPEPRFGADGKPLPQVYRISSRDTAEIQFRMLDGVNALRQARGAAPVRLNSELTAAAKTHSQDMSVQ
ncbi:MAG: CAP domain-containing protein, partial [Silicimonas sp.]|nr:CAP domain-containing protein [Silicimonas sp.]